MLALSEMEGPSLELNSPKTPARKDFLGKKVGKLGAEIVNKKPDGAGVVVKANILYGRHLFPLNFLLMCLGKQEMPQLSGPCYPI